MYYVSVTDYCLSSGPTDTPLHASIFVPGTCMFCCMVLDSHAYSRSTLNAFSVWENVQTFFD